MTNPAPQRCGLVAVIGAPNAGKSTLINQLVGGKVSIVSATVQTTRTTVRGIVSQDQTQIIFIDTPGLFDPQRKLERAMVAAAWNSREDADFILLICDASSKKAIRQTENIIGRLKPQVDERVQRTEVGHARHQPLGSERDRRRQPCEPD